MRTTTQIIAVLLVAACSTQSSTPPVDNPPSTDPNPNLVEPAGAFAAAEGLTLSYPVRLAVAGDVIWVSDYAADRVVGLRDGVPSVAIERVSRPLGVAVAGGLLYVGSEGRGTVEVYDLATRAGVRAVTGFAKPNAIAVAADGEIVVVDSKASVVRVLGADLAVRRTLGEGQLRYPVAVAIDGTRVYVADQGNHRVALFEKGGAFVAGLGAEMTQNRSIDDCRGRFTTITGLAFAGEDLYVLDAAHSYVQVLDRGGGPRGIIGHAGDCASCVKLALDVAVAPDGRVLATDPEQRRVVALSTEMR